MRWFRIRKAQIDPELRIALEQYGVPVMQQILSVGSNFRQAGRAVWIEAVRDSVLLWLTMSGWVELLILVGHGAGLGAMKIARGMFETSVMAEYLRLVPEEVEDYMGYSNVIGFKRLKQYSGPVSEEEFAEFEKGYKQVKARFEVNGKVRRQWHKHPIPYMAEKVGRTDEYELSYSIAASIHHGNFEALMAHLRLHETSFEVEQPPSLAWIKEALVAGHVYLLHSLITLNEVCSLGFHSRMDATQEEFEKIWRKP
jgi:Family of unknown function (DUF5677)